MTRSSLSSIELTFGDHPAVERSKFACFKATIGFVLKASIGKDGYAFPYTSLYEYTRWAYCKVCGKAHSAASSLSDQDARFQPYVLSRIRFKHDLTLDLPTCLWMIRGGETVSDSIFLHDLCKLVIAEMSSAITYDSSRGTKSGEERF
ncbi:hypothetical protein Tco_1362759 [Tanacetum coccineum]